MSLANEMSLGLIDAGCWRLVKTLGWKLVENISVNSVSKKFQLLFFWVFFLWSAVQGMNSCQIALMSKELRRIVDGMDY